MTEKIQLEKNIPSEYAGLRLDQALSQLFPQYSRTLLQHWIRTGCVTLNGKISQKTREKTVAHQVIRICADIPSVERWQAQAIPLDILYEDSDVLIVNKPAGLIVHPGAGAQNNTLVNALLYHVPELAQVPRAGIIHRLDKDTSGVLVIARHRAAHHILVQQMKQRQIQREYAAIATGILRSGGKIDAPIGRHPVYRTRMAIIATGRPAVTHYRVIERFRAHTYLRIQLETGRTHQIRVHLAYIRRPLLGDPVYGKNSLPARLSPTIKDALYTFQRQALHAMTLSLIHPTSQKKMTWQAPLPEDMLQCLRLLREDAQKPK
ncbi:MAG: RNA pseudouridine synthase [Coxiella sp. RIFCSPHIGHO2_12_FULL_44_14]|nr:MAG: RNA pseudouridine synthase [Coxiella sp. RIFCSPHIGHO2_12_FULL_44_14]